MSEPAYGRVLKHPCADCGSAMKLRSSRFGPFYGCVDYPRCRGTHGAHKATGEPLGVPANRETKAARGRAHAAFDPLWNSGSMTRREAYKWLAERLGTDEAHMGEMDVETCERVVEACREHREGGGRS